MDCAVQLMGTDGGQVLHGQGHYRVISQVHQHISRWNVSQTGSAEAHPQANEAFSTTFSLPLTMTQATLTYPLKIP